MLFRNAANGMTIFFDDPSAIDGLMTASLDR